MSTYTGSAFATKYAAYLIYKGSATAAALNISQPKIGYVYDITEGGTLTPGNITVQQGDAVVYLAQGWTHCNNGGADQAIADLFSQFDELLEEIGETDFSKFALKTELPTVPTNVSAFTNDAGYLTQHQSLANYALKTEIPDVSDFAPYSAIPHNVSQLNNDAHYLTEAILNNRVRKVDDLAQDTDATDGEIVQLTTDGRFYRFTEPQAEGESGTWTTINQPADIASNDQILSQNNSGKLTATLGMSYNSTNQHLELTGNDDAVVAYVDMAVFIKDGMLENVEKYTTPEQGVTVAVPYLKFTFNTDSGKSVIRISFADLIDTFDGSNVDLTSAFVKAAQYSAPAIGDSMDVAIGKLLKGHEDNATAISGKQDTLTFDDAPQSGSNRPVTSQGIKTAIDAVAASAAQGLKGVDLTTYQGGEDGEIVMHAGPTTSDYINGHFYKCTLTEETIVPSGKPYITIPENEYNITPDTYYKTSSQGTSRKFCDANGSPSGNYNVPTYIFKSIDNNTIEVVASGGLQNCVATGRMYGQYEIAVYYGYNTTTEPVVVHIKSWQEISPTDITGAASTITTANLTPSKVLGSDANGKVAATSIATTDAEDAVAKRHTQNTDTQIVTPNGSWKLKMEDTNGLRFYNSNQQIQFEFNTSRATFYRPLYLSSNNNLTLASGNLLVGGDGSITGDLSVSGNLNVTGKETVEEIVNIKSENNFITLRDGAQTAIASGSLSGTKVENYDGLGNDLLFGTDASGVFRIGDDGGTLEPIATRDEAANLTDGQLMKWDDANQRLVGTSDIAPQINSYVASKAMTEDSYWDLVTTGTVQADTLYITYDNDWEG